MSTTEGFRIFCDARFGADSMRRLEEGARPHPLVWAGRPTTSVLGRGDSDPLFGTVEIAFGQPDVGDIGASGRLRWVEVSSAGYTRYDTPEFRELAARRGLVVTNSSQVYAQACAEHVLAFLMAQARMLPAGLRTREANGTPAWRAIREGSRSPSGQRMLILGYGVIAERLVRLLAPFGMELVAYRRRVRGDEVVPVVTGDGLERELGLADHVVNILPENADSRGFMGRRRFAQMKPGAIFYNIGRGTTVDQDALAESLTGGHVGAAWLDVTDPEPLPPGHLLWGAPNCHITPHTAGGHANEDDSRVNHFLANLRRFERGEPLLDRVM
jgi:phosphoglycerate dehydrogenase-like enzyme